MPKSETGNYRWMVVTFLFFATTINYIDRSVMGVLEPTIAGDLHWTNTTYGVINGIFQACYALGLLLFGWIVHKLGTKKAYIISIITWSLSAMAHSLVRTTGGFIAVRSALGIGEGGNFPTAIKVCAEWFPKRERALATGIFNSGANIGAVVVPIVIPFILTLYGWRASFLFTGILSLTWLFFWWTRYEIPTRKKGLSQAEFDHIHSDNEDVATVNEQPLSWGKLIRVRQTWAFIVGKFLTDPIWWFFLFWLPPYFKDTFSLDLHKPGWPLVIVYSSSTIGSIGGGLLSSWLIRKGWAVNRARRSAMLLFACCVVPIVSVRYFSGIWTVVALISLAAAAHQAWSANIFTTASDMFPKRAVSSVVGIGGMFGSVGGIFFQPLVGWILDFFKRQQNISLGYNLIFIICGSAYLLAWIVMGLLAPGMKAAKL